MVDKDIVKKIEELFCNWYGKKMFDSTGRLGIAEKKELIEFCSQHIEEFKDFAKDTLEHPQECCYLVAAICYELLPDVIQEENNEEMDEIEMSSFIKKLQESSKLREYLIWSSPNEWLNYFKGTKNIDYYKDYVDYKEYLRYHYVSWKPNEEDDPNPSYKEFVEHREKYKI